METLLTNSKQGNLHINKHDWRGAQKPFEKILETHKDDGYALTTLGNIFFTAGFDHKQSQVRVESDDAMSERRTD